MAATATPTPKTNRIGPVILAHLYADVGGTLWYALRQ